MFLCQDGTPNITYLGKKKLASKKYLRVELFDILKQPTPLALWIQ